MTPRWWITANAVALLIALLVPTGSRNTIVVIALCAVNGIAFGIEAASRQSDKTALYSRMLCVAWTIAAVALANWLPEWPTIFIFVWYGGSLLALVTALGIGVYRDRKSFREIPYTRLGMLMLGLLAALTMVTDRLIREPDFWATIAVVFFIPAWLTPTIASAFLAAKKNRSSAGWAILSLLLGPAPILLLTALPPKRPGPEPSQNPSASPVLETPPA